MLLTSTEIISKSWDDYLKNWHNWLIFSMLIFLPSFVLMLSGSFGGFLNTYLPATTMPTDILIVLLALVSAVFGIWTSISLVHAAAKFLRSNKTDQWKEHYAATLNLIWPAIFTSFFAGVFVFLGVIFFLIPGIIFSIWYFFIIYNVVVDEESGFKALASSKKLVTGRWWSVTWRIAVPWLFFGTAALIIQGILLTAVNSLPLSVFSEAIVDNVIKGIVSALVAPLTTLAGLNLFNNLRSNPFRERPAILSHDSPAD